VNAPSIHPIPHSRDLAIDAMRGLAITLVVLGHSIEAAYPTSYTTMPLHVIIYSFHLPLFVFLSGMLTYREQPLPRLRFIQRRASALLVPYVAWLIVWWSISEIRGGAPASLLRTLGESLVNPRTENALWFFYVLFECCVIFALTSNMGRHPRALVLGAIIAAAAYLLQLGWQLPLFDLRRLELLYPFFVIGYFVTRTRLREHLRLRALWVAIPAYALALAVSWPGTRGLPALQVALERRGDVLGLIGAGGVGIVALIAALAAITVVLIAYDASPARILAPQAWVGQRSLGIYASHKRVVYLAVLAGIPGYLLPALAGLGVAIGLTEVLSRVPVLAMLFLGQRLPKRGR